MGRDLIWFVNWMLWGVAIILSLAYILLTRLDQPTLTFADQLRRVTADLATLDRTIRKPQP